MGGSWFNRMLDRRKEMSEGSSGRKKRLGDIRGLGNGDSGNWKGCRRKVGSGVSMG